MAKLHNTSIQALRHYDQLGLLTPVHVDESSGYRYYSTGQFEQLNTIHYLKGLGFSLKEIKEQLNRRDLQGFLTMMEKQKDATEAKIRELQRISIKFQRRINEVHEAAGIQNVGIPELRHIGERNILRLNETITSEPHWEMSLRRLENESNQISSVFVGRVGLTVSVQHLLSGKFDEYNSIFLLTEDERFDSSLAAVLPDGSYACMYYRGNHADSPGYYTLLLDYIRHNGLQVAGDSIERTLIDHFISGKPEDYLTELQIPVK
jgi:effector-binding domain-containing protein/DNA-binding transcriptional MerR regulator